MLCVYIYVYYYAPSVIYYFSWRGIVQRLWPAGWNQDHPHTKDNGGKHCHPHNTITIILRLYNIFFSFSSPSQIQGFLIFLSFSHHIRYYNIQLQTYISWGVTVRAVNEVHHTHIPRYNTPTKNFIGAQWSR